MRVGVMTTDGGPHPADKWAAETAGEIMSYVKVDDSSDTPEAAAVRRAKPRLELDIAEVLEQYHDENIEAERDALADEGNERLLKPYAVDEEVVRKAALSVVKVAEKYGEPFASSFASQPAIAIIASAIRVHFRTAHDVERGWHADRAWRAGDIDEHVKRFKSQGRGI